MKNDIQFEKVRKKVDQLGDKVEDQKCQVCRKKVSKKTFAEWIL